MDLPTEITITKATTETPTDGSKPYTQYTLSIRGPVVSHIATKRYSDFAALHAALTSAVGSPPPEPLPAKSWFRSTVSSAELTEQRRAGLQRYLRAIAEPPDRRWRDTSQWRAFLNLPVAAFGAGSGGGEGKNKAAAVWRRDAEASDPGGWMNLHMQLKAELQAAQAAVARKESAPEQGERLEAGTQAKKALIGAGNLLLLLKEGLETMKKEERLMDGEYNRRKNMLAVADNDKNGLEQVNKSVTGRVARPEGAGGEEVGVPLPETDDTRTRDNVDVKNLNDLKMKKQDEEVELLRKSVQAQRYFASEIHKESEESKLQLDHALQKADDVAGKLHVADARIKRL
ncbi:hypothetical protein N0V88_001594 [Collariella sp. IMI 366227]|nr:hypothetical protein N0V88_001594 [Collariella sp. IMI 366227]